MAEKWPGVRQTEFLTDALAAKRNNMTHARQHRAIELVLGPVRRVVGRHNAATIVTHHNVAHCPEGCPHNLRHWCDWCMMSSANLEQSQAALMVRILSFMQLSSVKTSSSSPLPSHCH